jgi:hypothetical protein
MYLCKYAKDLLKAECVMLNNECRQATLKEERAETHKGINKCLFYNEILTAKSPAGAGLFYI